MEEKLGRNRDRKTLVRNKKTERGSRMLRRQRKGDKSRKTG
jgi:hypothetical protein